MISKEKELRSIIPTLNFFHNSLKTCYNENNAFEKVLSYMKESAWYTASQVDLYLI